MSHSYLHLKHLLLSGVALILTARAYAIPHGIGRRTQIQKIKNHPLVVLIDVPETIADMKTSKISLTIKNKGTEEITVVKDPASPLYDSVLPVDAWLWENQETKEPAAFRGARVDWTLDSYLASPGREITSLEDLPEDDQSSDETSDEEDINISTPPLGTTFTLAGGASKEFTYKVGRAYDFEISGPGFYQVDLLRKSFWVITGHDKTRKLYEVEIETEPHTVKISESQRNDDRLGLELEKREDIVTTNCNVIKKWVIQRSAHKADKYVKETYEYLTGPNAGGERYKWWFGEWDAPNARAHPSTPDELVRQKVIGAFQTMKMRKFESSRYDYNCDCDQNINSFVYPTRYVHPEIFICKRFFTLDVSFSGRAGSLIHEATHFPDVLGTEDYTYNFAECHELAAEPTKAMMNANNYKFIADNRDGRT